MAACKSNSDEFAYESNERVTKLTFTISMLTKETLEKDVNCEHILHLFLVFLLLTLNM